MKRTLSILLAMLIIATMFVLPASAEGKKSGLFTYEIKGNGTAIITDFDWAANGNADIYIPRMLDGYTVTEIGASSFSEEGASIEKMCGQAVVVVIPDTITVIGEKAFFSSAITAANIPSSVQLIGAGAFAGCCNIKQFSVDGGNAVYATIEGVLYNKVQKELVAYPVNEEYISIPNGILSVGPYACYSLPNVERYWMIGIYNKTITSIGDYAFWGLHCKYEQVIGNTVFPNTLQKIGNYAFYETDLGEVEFGNELQHIGEYAFSEATLRTAKRDKWKGIALPSSVTYIGEGAFMEADIDGIDISATKITTLEPYTLYHLALNYGVQLPNTLKTIDAYALAYTAQYGGCTIPASVERIEEYAFYNSKYVAQSSGDNIRIVFGENSELEYIGNEAFAKITWESRWDGVYNITLPNGLIEIGENAFANTVGLSKLYLPASVTSIGDGLCNRADVTLEVEAGSYGAIYASENGYITAGNEDTSWLNG